MRKKVLFLILIIIIIVSILFMLFNTKKEYIFINNNDFYFGMSKNNITKILSKPNYTNLNSYDASIDEYVYITDINQHKALYNFCFFKSRLIEMSLTIEDIDCDLALSMVKDCMDKQKKYYSNEGYFASETEKINNTNFSVSSGVNYGATGISFEYEYSYGKLILSAIKQQ